MALRVDPLEIIRRRHRVLNDKKQTWRKRKNLNSFHSYSQSGPLRSGPVESGWLDDVFFVIPPTFGSVFLFLWGVFCANRNVFISTKLSWMGRPTDRLVVLGRSIRLSLWNADYEETIVSWSLCWIRWRLAGWKAGSRRALIDGTTNKQANERTNVRTLSNFIPAQMKVIGNTCDLRSFKCFPLFICWQPSMEHFSP